MESPITRVFGLPELALHLEPFLFPQDVAYLMQTCRTLYSMFLIRYNQKAHDFSSLFLLDHELQTPRSLGDVATNAFHLRSITLDGKSCRKYYDDFKDVYLLSAPLSPSPFSPSRFPVRPSSGYLSAQAGYFLQGSLRLTALHMHNIKVENFKKSTEWAATISELKMLETLYLDFVTPPSNHVPMIIPIVFAKCHLRSLKSVTLLSHGSSELYALYSNVDPTKDDLFFNVSALTSNNSDQSTTPPQYKDDNLLPDLKEWETINTYSKPFEPFLEMLLHCPNLVPVESRQPLFRYDSPSTPSPSSLVVRIFAAGIFRRGRPDTRSLPQTLDIQKRCTDTLCAVIDFLQENTLASVKLTRYEGMQEDDAEEEEEEDKKEKVVEEKTMSKIKKWESMREVKCVRTLMDSISYLRAMQAVKDRLGSRMKRTSRTPLMRHFESLRRFEVHKCRRLSASSLLEVLFICPHLEVYNVLTTSIRLEDLVEENWASTRIQELSITIDTGVIHIPVRPSNRDDFDQQQKEKVERLETLYRQLNRLTELKVLDTRRYIKSLTPQVDFRSVRSMSEYSLPGLLTVSDKDPEGGDNWGGLQLLTRIKNLTILRGMFPINVASMPEFIMGENDVAWVADNWPKLERVEFSAGDYATDSPEVLSSIGWLQTKLAHVEFSPFTV